MKAGDLRERVAIQRATSTRDEYNAEVLSWTTVATVWAQVVERGGRAPLLAERPVMVVSYEVTIRSGLEVSHKDRLVWRGKTLEIDTVTPQPADGLLVLRCVEVEL
jgi:SPP1 family predicted phage head-tail adaptor